MRNNNNYDSYSKKELIREIKKLKKRKKYGIVWEPKEEKVVQLCKEKLPVLKERKSMEIKSKNNLPINVLIEGDNYHTLSVLNYTHKGKIDFIYIDPPYNTKNKEFIFNDHYVDLEDSYRHSKWLSFISKRLKLAKNLLKNDGVIFISIDENEQSQLKLLCDEIFLEKNYIATIIWQKVYSTKNQSKRISTDHEYILCYAKNIDRADFQLLSRTEKMDKRYKNSDNDTRGPWQSGDLIANEERKKGHYIIVGPSGYQFDAPAGKHWAYSKETLLSLIDDNRVWFGKKGKSFPRLKQFLSEVQQGKKASTLFFHEEVGHSDEGKKELKLFFEQSEDLFSTPKPSRLIKQLLRLCMNKNATVLDFMAGSGTTGQAVIELNKEDGGLRKFIICTNNEVDDKTDKKLREKGLAPGEKEYEKHGICQKVCYPRIKKVIKGYDFKGRNKETLFQKKINLSDFDRWPIINAGIEKITNEKRNFYDKIQREFKNCNLKILGINNIDEFKEGLDGNLKYFETDFVDAEPTDRNKKKLVDQSTEMLCLREYCFDEVKSNKYYRIFKNSKRKFLGIIYDDSGIEPFKKEVRMLNKKFNVYVFSLDESAREEDFEEIIDLVDLKPIPEVILNVYRRIFK